MDNSKPGWTSILQRQGPVFLAWIEANDVLTAKFTALAKAISTLLLREIITPETARSVWEATPAILTACNEQSTYAKPGAALSYAWLHLLDRYARTWAALELLVRFNCLPMAKDGVSALDVGTGPGPSAFAIHDFYVAMTEFAAASGIEHWRQPPTLTCVEFDSTTNYYRHQLAEILFMQAGQQNKGVLAMCHALSDFHPIMPTKERKRLRNALLYEQDRYFDAIDDDWTSASAYTSEEASYLAQSLHRYRLIVFSNFLTTVGTVHTFEANLIDIFTDAQPGSVVMVIGGKEKQYPEVYRFVERLASAGGFDLEVPHTLGKSITVSSADTAVGNQVYDEGARIFHHLQTLSPDIVDSDPVTQAVRSHFTESRVRASSSQLWAFRKRKWLRTI